MISQLQLKNAVLQAIANDVLPEGFELYCVDDRALFEIRGPSGGVVSQHVFYIIKKFGEHNFWRQAVGMRVNESLSFDFIRAKIEKGLKEFQENIKGNPELIGEGGDLGLPEKEEKP